MSDATREQTSNGCIAPLIDIEVPVVYRRETHREWLISVINQHVALAVSQCEAKARLEGARAMQVKAAKTNLENTGKEWVMNSLWDNMAKRFSKSILSLDPQQAINESAK
jgi:hypothetical protein